MLVAGGLQDLGCDQLTLAAHHAVERAGAVLDQLGGDERAAVAAGEDEALRPALTRLPREVEDFGDVGEVVEREADCLRLEALELTEVVLVGENLQIGRASCRERG